MITMRMAMLLAATTVAAGTTATSSLAQSAGTSIPTFAELRAPIDPGADTPRSRLAPGSIGLRPHASGTYQGIDLPFGMNYSRETKSLVVPLDQKNEWGVGLNLNLNSVPAIEQSPSAGIGLQPKRTPGVTLHKKF